MPRLETNEPVSSLETYGYGCQREERDAYQQEREEAHEQLDRDLGY